MSDYVHEYWIILPILGMGLGAFAIWSEYSRQRKALDVLRAYAERGEEPPKPVLSVLSRASASGDSPRAPPWERFAFYAVMTIGFGLTTAWFAQSGARSWVFTLGFGITCFVMAAYAAQALVAALRPTRLDE